MTVLRVFSHDHNAGDVAKQEYELASTHYDEVCARFDARSEASVSQFQSAQVRRDAALDEYLKALRS